MRECHLYNYIANHPGCPNTTYWKYLGMFDHIKTTTINKLKSTKTCYKFVVVQCT